MYLTGHRGLESSLEKSLLLAGIPVLATFYLVDNLN